MVRSERADTDIERKTDRRHQDTWFDGAAEQAIIHKTTATHALFSMSPLTIPKPAQYNYAYD